MPPDPLRVVVKGGLRQQGQLGVIPLQLWPGTPPGVGQEESGPPGHPLLPWSPPCLPDKWMGLTASGVVFKVVL